MTDMAQEDERREEQADGHGEETNEDQKELNQEELNQEELNQEELNQEELNQEELDRKEMNNVPKKEPLPGNATVSLSDSKFMFYKTNTIKNKVL